MKYAFACFFSALLGGVVAVALTNTPQARLAVAADPPRTGPALVPPARADRPADPPRKTTPRAEAAPVETALAPYNDVSPEEKINIAVYERVNKSVAHLTTKGVKADAVFLLDLPTEGAGSGSVLDKAGHILTNNHVIEDARQVNVTLYDGKSYEAKFVGADPVNDVAVIKVDAPPEVLVPVLLGDSARLKVGMRVFALGNPFGLERTLTTGIISSLNRSLQIYNNRTINSIIQIDAAINPGNSGGPLLDTSSRLIGMNTAIATKTGQSSGVGFAIPVNLIARIVPQLIERGHVVRPEIGIARVYETGHGLLIARLIPGGPAERAGLQGPQVVTRRRGPFVLESVDRSAADLIVAIDGKNITTADEFLGAIEAKSPADLVTLTIVRQTRELQVPVQLGGDGAPTGPPKTRL